ncbi:MAG TPA: hypothetical protein PLS12_06120, partial [Bacteroidales bacterium]|nr:hypothetical protein [Bacteroidales bacterium]
YPNNVTATMERNCVDVIKRALKIEKTFDRSKANKGNLVTCTINFENSADAGWIDGGRPGVRVSYAHDGLANPASAPAHALKIRLFHDAVEPYINYGNYRISYFMHDPSISCLAATTGCGTGWVLANDIYEGGTAAGVTVLHENIVAGSDARGSWNQRLVAQFAPLLVTTTTHLSNYYGLTIRVHQGGTEPLRAKWRMHTNTYTNVDWSNDWSWNATANDADGGNYHPITPDWTDIYNPNKPINSWHPNACQTATKTVDNLLVEEFDGYTWRRILGNGPVPGRDIANVVIRDTLPVGMTFGAFTGTNPFGIAPTVTTIAGGKQVITWTIPKLQVNQKGKIVYTATVNFPSGKNCETTDEDIINYAWIQGTNESPISDTAKITVTCAKIPTVIPPSSLKKTADKTTYSSGDAITYTLEYTQTHGTISVPPLTSNTDWTGSGWTASAGKLSSIGGTTTKMTYDWAYGQNGFIEGTVTQAEYATYRVLLREGAATPIAISIKKEYGTQLVISYIQGTTVINTQTVTYGGTTSPYTLKVHLYNDVLRIWVNSDTTQSPIYSRTGVPIGVGFAGFANGGPADAHGVHQITNLRFHFDYAFNMTMVDPKPTEITYTSSSNSGTFASDTVRWTIPSGKGAGIPFGTKITRTWTGTVNSCNTMLENIAYVNIMGYAYNSIAGQAIVNCGASCPSAPTVTTPVNYCKGATATPLTATGTALKWYTVATGGTGSTTAPTPSTATAGTTTYYVSQTANGCESVRAAINVIVTETPAPTVTTPVNYCKDATATALTATGTALKWYTVATGGTALASAPTPSTATAGTTTYYVSQTANGCESARAAINVVVTETPAPTVTTPVNYCKDATATALTATGTALKWYTVATGGTALASAPTPSTTTAGTTTYYVSQTANGCESARAAINVVVTETPAPTVTTPVNYCKGATATALTATGTSLKWYTVATGGTALASAPTPSTANNGTTSYYVSQTLNSCESNRAQIDVIVSEPTIPTVTSPVTYCQNDVATALTASGTNLAWYTVATGGTSSATAPTPATNTSGTTSYYVSQKIGTCESARAEIQVIIKPKPTVTVQSVTPKCIDASAVTLSATA